MSLPETPLLEKADTIAEGPSMNLTGADLPMLLAYLRQRGWHVTPDPQWLGGYRNGFQKYSLF